MNFWKKQPEPPPIRLRFYPEPDITLYEFAMIVSKCDPRGDVYFRPEQWTALDPTIQRHFK